MFPPSLSKSAQPTYRLIAIDLDGTLLAPNGHVSDRTKTAIRRALDAGLLVCFATGRNWTESKLVIDAVAHYGNAVFAGGAMIVDTEKQVVLHRMNMSPALAAEVCGFIESAGYPAMALQDATITGVDYLITERISLQPATVEWLATMNTVMHRTANLDSHGHEHTIRIGTVGPIADVTKLHKKMLAVFEGRVMCQRIDVTERGFAVLETFDLAVNKWQGILKVAERHGVPEEQIIAIGDDVNDLPMIEHAGLGVAMGNAKPEVKAIADRIVGSNADDGLAEFLEELVDLGRVAPPPW